MLGQAFTLVSIVSMLAQVYDQHVQRRRQRDADERERRRELEKDQRLAALEERLAKLEGKEPRG